jgi:hypothetical protein
MMERTHPARVRIQRGQTIIVALIILGLLLILGFVFLGIINRSIIGSARQQTRSAANDLAEAGIRYAHTQLLRSPEGADWRGQLRAPIADGVGSNSSKDPDAVYLRLPSGFNLANGLRDLGGPDGLGSYVRVDFQNGRSLVRVRYAPSDANLFSASPAGALRNPGAVRNYLILESVGRAGAINALDPTSFQTSNAIQVRGFASQAQFLQEIGRASRLTRQANDRILTALVSIGITDTARSITNIHRVSRPAEIGIPRSLGSSYPRYNTTPITVANVVPTQLGQPSLEQTIGTSSLFNIGGLGSMHSNADITFYGNVNLYANVSLGDQLTVAGNVTGEDGATLNIFRQEFNRTTGTWNALQTYNLAAGGALNSRSSAFNTAGGVFRDGVAQADVDGFSRGVGYRMPPTITTVDPETGENRYVQMTRESGEAVAGGRNSGAFGHGQGVYVDNAADQQVPASEASRQANPGSASLVFDWLNPNHTDSKYWFGPYYVPPAASVIFRPDGFVVTRDSRAPAEERFWKRPNGTVTTSSAITYRFGRGTDGRLHLVNSLTSGVANVEAPLDAATYQLGPAFNGVLYFEGNVRVRGVIPTDIQLNVVANGTIYVDGSITKGITGNQFTATYSPSNGAPESATAVGDRINRPSRSMLALMARDYVTVNTTMFFGPSGTQSLDAGRDVNSVRVRQDAELSLLSEFVSGPNTAADNYSPSAWLPFALTYRDALTSAQQTTKLLVSHAMEDGAADRTFISANVNPALFDSPTIVSTYLFPFGGANAASGAFTGPGKIPVLGLGQENWQRFPKYETIAFDLVNPLTATSSGNLITANGAEGNYRLFNQGTNELTLRPNPLNGQPSNDYLLARASIVPHDVRVDALIYAQEGSFFVIPGYWFNGNANDRRDTYFDRIRTLTTQGSNLAQATAIANDERLATFGSNPEAPFYGEPLDIRMVINGAVAENMPPSIAQQSEWIKKWGWIPGRQGASTANIPARHVPAGTDLNATPVVPNLVISYDPVLGSGRTDGFANLSTDSRILRTDSAGRVLPPLPRLPVSPAFAYFGDVN